jgi:transcriptional regulator with XRE-family HTH domain
MAGKRPAAFEEPSEYELKLRIARWAQYYLRIRTEKGVSQREFADTLGVSEVTVSNIKSGKDKGGLKTLYRLHFRLGADLREMVREDPPVFTSEPQPNGLPSTQTNVRSKR